MIGNEVLNKHEMLFNKFNTFNAIDLHPIMEEPLCDFINVSKKLSTVSQIHDNIFWLHGKGKLNGISNQI